MLRFMGENVREQYERAEELDKLTHRLRLDAAAHDPGLAAANPLPYPGVDSRLHKSTF
jgi:hypothetical protein